MEFNFEDQCSSAGSVSCCSLVDSQDDLPFLNDLGIKFKTLAEICSPPEKILPFTPSTPTPSIATLSHYVADTVGTSQHVDKTIRPQREPFGETTQIDGRADTLISSYITSKSSDSNVNVSPPSMNLARTKATTISHSSKISQAAALLPQSQTVLIQPHPVYYTTSSVVQPVQYVLQPQLQNMVLLTDETSRASHSGLFIVHGSKNAPVQVSASGMVVQGIEQNKKLVDRVSPTSPTVVLPVSSGMAQRSLSVDSWKIVVPNPNSKRTFVSPVLANRISVDETERDLVSQDTLHRGAITVKKAAPPQEH